VVEKHGALFPRTVDELSALPGIGRSTAAAIAAFAFGTRAAILDGNVKRVFARHFGIDGFPGATAVERRLWTLADELLPSDGIETYTQGLMDLGATLCTRSNPGCRVCPVSATCVAKAENRTAELPAPRPVKPRPLRHVALLIVRDERGAILLETRPPSGIWGGLVSLPEFDAEAPEDDVRRGLAARYGLDVEFGERLPELRHEFSHYSLLMYPRLARVRAASSLASTAARFVEPGAVQECALPAPIRRLLRGVEARG
jgi:A/G-specific adenine glycosylase